MNNEMPIAMRRWVERQRSRALGLPTEQKQLVEQQIQEIIDEAVGGGKVWLNNWTLQGLPIFDGNTSHLLFWDNKYSTLAAAESDKRKRPSPMISTNPMPASKPIEPSSTKIHHSYTPQNNVATPVPQSTQFKDRISTERPQHHGITSNSPRPTQTTNAASMVPVLPEKDKPTNQQYLVNDYQQIPAVSRHYERETTPVSTNSNIRRVPEYMQNERESHEPVEEIMDDAPSTISLPYHEYRYPYPPITGVSRKEERSWKRYLRSEAPSARDIRDLETLESWFFKLEERYISNDDSTVSYSYVQDQMRAIEQDLYFQDIHNAFTLIVYEAHIHLNIKYKNIDDGEFEILCIKLLDYFYKLPENIRKNDENKFEITNYYVIYLIYKEEKDKLKEFMISIRELAKSADRSMKFIFNFFKSYHLRNYYELFKLYQISSKYYLDQTLIDLFIDRERLHCLEYLKNVHHLEKVNFEYLLLNLRFKDEISAIHFFKKHNLEKFISIGPTFIEFNLSFF